MGNTVCCLLLIIALISRNRAVVVDIKAKGAKGDGKTDDGPVIMTYIHQSIIYFFCVPYDVFCSIYRVRFKCKLKFNCEHEDGRERDTYPVRLIFSLNNTILFTLNIMHYSR